MRANVPVIADEAGLEDFMSAPSERVVERVGAIKGDIVILGVAGKVGVTLAMMLAKAVKKAGTSSKVYGVSRFSDPKAKEHLAIFGVRPLGVDLLDPAQVAALPGSENVFFLAGKKFGTVGAQDLTWATNTIAPANAAQRYKGARIVAYSTGCVYDFKTAASGGALELEDPNPTGEYAQSTLGRERVFEYYSRKDGTRVCQFRLNYAIDLRYGVLRDIADRVYSGQAVDLSVGSLNCIWQGDVLERTVLSLDLCESPAKAINITGPETASIRWLAEEFGRRFGKAPCFSGNEKPDSKAYLANAAKSFALFGYPAISLETMIDMTAVWVASGGSSLGKPTHFEQTDGKY
ncbi:MAG: NAD-dependent epimerase/dehydratase [Spirochaetes bacterium]|nr:MAG: NAD-dependent epimerase/dehydratase [Spirochaetota bacterium]